MYGDSPCGVGTPGIMENAPDHQAEILLASYEAGGESALCRVQRLCFNKEPVSSPANDSCAGVSRSHQANGTYTHRPHRGVTSYGWQW